MPSLSFDKETKATPVALVKGGKFDGEILYLHEGDSSGRRPTKLLDRTKWSKELKGMKPAEKTRIMTALEEAMSRDTKPEDLVETTSN